MINRVPRFWNSACYDCRDPDFLVVKIQAEDSRAPRRSGEEKEGIETFRLKLLR